MRLRIEVEPQAVTQLEELDAWWREHRRDSRISIPDEFERVLSALSAQPEMGSTYERGGIRSVRWVRMRGTPYKLYYHYQRDSELLSVIAIWSGMRGFGPPMERR